MSLRTPIYATDSTRGFIKCRFWSSDGSKWSKKKDAVLILSVEFKSEEIEFKFIFSRQKLYINWKLFLLILYSKRVLLFLLVTSRRRRFSQPNSLWLRLVSYWLTIEGENVGVENFGVAGSSLGTPRCALHPTPTRMRKWRWTWGEWVL